MVLDDGLKFQTCWFEIDPSIPPIIELVCTELY